MDMMKREHHANGRQIGIITLCLFSLLFLLGACGSNERTVPETAAETLEQQEKLPLTTLELDELFGELAASGQRTNEALERLKEEDKEFLLRYLMIDFMAGKLEGCVPGDGSVEYHKYIAWSSMLEGETIPLETETVQEYWLEWCQLAKHGGGEDLPVTNIYLELMERELPSKEEELDALFEELSQTGQRTNETLQLMKAREPDRLFDYLVMEFLGGELENCQVDDGSAGTLKFNTWAGLLKFEGIESPLFSPQQYWEDWSSHAQNLYERNGYDALIELGNPLTARCGQLMEEYLS